MKTTEIGIQAIMIMLVTACSQETKVEQPIREAFRTPMFASIFRLRDNQVTFVGGGDARDTFTKFGDDVEAIALTEVYCPLGQFGTGNDKRYVGSIALDKHDKRLFINKDWICFPGEVRRVKYGGPFATVFVVCRRAGKPVSGWSVMVNNVVSDTTDTDGWGTIKLKRIKERVLPVTVVSPNLQHSITASFAVPIVSARPDMVFYKRLNIDIP